MHLCQWTMIWKKTSQRRSTSPEFRKTNMDRVLEFLIFKREGDELLPELREELVKLVHRELQVEEALKDLGLERRMTAREGTPLLDALGTKLGKSFGHILAPPTSSFVLGQNQKIRF